MSWVVPVGTEPLTYEAVWDGATPNFEVVVDSDSYDGNDFWLSTELTGYNQWAEVGVGFGGSYGEDWYDLTNLTAVSFWACGEGMVRVALRTADVSRGYPEGDNWGQFSTIVHLTGEWRQHVILPEMLQPITGSPAADDGLLWEDARDQVNAIDLSVPWEYRAPVVLRLDELRLHGVAYEDFGFTNE